MKRSFAVAALAGFGIAVSAQAELKMPWEMRGYVPGPREKSVWKTCAKPPKPVQDIKGVRYYADAQNSKVDKAKYAANERATKPVRDFSQGLSRIADAYFFDRNEDAAACAAKWLEAWAKGSALLGGFNDQGAYERNWNLAAIAFQYLRIRGSSKLGAAQKESIVAWLKAVTESLRKPYDDHAREPSRNNHGAWAALSAGLVAVAADDSKLWTWALNHYQVVTDEAKDGGVLPLEAARGARALHYHHFAALPLVLLAEIGKTNGKDLYGYSGHAVDHLADLLISHLGDPKKFATKAGGTPQEGVANDDYAWLEIYSPYAKSAAVNEFILKHRPFRSPQLKVDMTAVFGDSLPKLK